MKINKDSSIGDMILFLSKIKYNDNGMLKNITLQNGGFREYIYYDNQLIWYFKQIFCNRHNYQLIIDNNSNDGTKEYLTELKANNQIDTLHLLNENVGVACAVLENEIEKLESIIQELK